MTPTCNELTSTLCGAPSCDTALVKAIWAARLTEGGARPAPLLHLREDEAAKADLCEQFQVEVGLPLLIGQCLGRAARRLAGIVDVDVDLAEFRIDLLAGGLDRK